MAGGLCASSSSPTVLRGASPEKPIRPRAGGTSVCELGDRVKPQSGRRESRLDDVAEVNEESLSADLLPDWSEDWVLMERERYHQLRLRALEALCRRLSAKGRFGQAVQAGLAAVSGEPLRESARRALIEAHLAERNLAAALREYEAFGQLLQSELGIGPSVDPNRVTDREDQTAPEAANPVTLA